MTNRLILPSTPKEGHQGIWFYSFGPAGQRFMGEYSIMLAVGAQDGPTLVVDACNHGDEYEGTEGIIKTFEGLDVSKMKGSFIGIPALNAEPLPK